MARIIVTVDPPSINYPPGDDPVEDLKQAYVDGDIDLETLEETLSWKLKKDYGETS